MRESIRKPLVSVVSVRTAEVFNNSEDSEYKHSLRILAEYILYIGTVGRD